MNGEAYMNRQMTLLISASFLILTLVLLASVVTVAVRRPVIVNPQAASEERFVGTQDVSRVGPSSTSMLTTLSIKNDRLRQIRDPVVSPGELSVTVPTLMYHYVRPITPEMTTSSRWLSVSPEHFRAQMEELVRLGYHTITPDDLADAVTGQKILPTKPVLITFDDGYRDQYTKAFPILKTHGLRATFFIISDYHLNPLYLTNDQIRELDQSGLITIAAHTRHHVGLADRQSDKQKDEIGGSKQDLEQVVGHPITAFAYPYGNFNAAVKRLVAEAGFRTGFSTILGSIHTSSSLFEARRIRVLDDEYLEPILKKFSR